MIHKNILKHMNIFKGERVKAASNYVERKNKKIIELVKSHEKLDLSNSIVYQYNIMKFSSYDEENMSLTDVFYF